ncbi:MAG: 2-oxoacid:acceptor oxidoreductase family protein [Prolixibacteraceae bacterium]|jgi:2-oxoglutarate ferredoxin oxidoreductase subunit gamma|nr:2-oxoacid:acceptor oxidoreductase family protein [Prolixibacteraceae bacterium]
MTEEIIIAGFGGQGVLSMGKILAYSGVMQDQEVTWMPSYGPEMRGGTANVTVILSDERISSPILHEYDTAIILNQQSMDKFEKTVKPGGTLLYDPNGIVKVPTRTDINIYKIEGTKKAAEMGNPKTFNMIILGAYLQVKPVVLLENVKKGLEKSLPERHHKLIPLNIDAIQKGMDSIESVHILDEAAKC